MRNTPIGDPVGPAPSYTYGRYEKISPLQGCTPVNPQKEIAELKKRIEELEEKLKSRGVVDIKFHVEKSEVTFSCVTENVCEFLEAMLEGKTRPFKGIGDSVK